MRFIRMLLAILLPPAAVFLTSGISSAFVVSIALTLLGWVPGVIHALWYMQKADERSGAY